jgi:hypothetical protein
MLIILKNPLGMAMLILFPSYVRILDFTYYRILSKNSSGSVHGKIRQSIRIE